MRPGRLAGLLGFCVLALTSWSVGGWGAQASAAPVPSAGERPLLVVSSPEAANWLRILRAGGFSALSEPVNFVDSSSAVVIPNGASMTQEQFSGLVSWVKEGGRLVTAAPGILEELGASYRSPVVVTGATMSGLVGSATWIAPVPVAPFRVKPTKLIRQVTVMSQATKALPIGSMLPPSPTSTTAPPDTTTTTTPATPIARGPALATSWRFGKGQVLGFAVDPMADNRVGYELFPTLAQMTGTVTAAPKGPTRNGLELYVDPGTLPAALAHDPQAIAALAQGARVVDVADWDFNFTDPANDYDYQALIDALHARGILAYAWMEPPYVNDFMWQTDPQCREKTETGRDAEVDGRLLMSLETPVCFQLAWKQWEQVLTSFSWDGVNVAELYFEPDYSLNNFTPFSPGALALFKKAPMADLNAFFRFRTQLETQLDQQMLAQLNGLPDAKNLAFELTVVDSSLDKSEATEVGANDSALAAVAKEEGAALEVEDPFTDWEAGPLRYATLDTRVGQLADRQNGLIDINDVQRENARPTSEMTGGELGLASSAAASGSGSLALYGLSSVAPSDLATLPGALAGAAKVTYSGVVAPWTVSVYAPPGAAHSRAEVDGRSWPTANGVAVVPAGQNSVSWSGGAPLGPGLTGFTGELSAASVSPAAMSLRYYSRSAAYAVVSAQPVGLSVDGSPSPFASVVDPGGGWSVRLPGGTHRITLSF